MLQAQQAMKREQALKDNLLQKLEQVLRVKAWANRDLKTTKQNWVTVMATSPPDPSKATASAASFNQ